MSEFTQAIRSAHNWITGEEPRDVAKIADRLLPVTLEPPKLSDQINLAAQFAGKRTTSDLAARRGYRSPLGFDNAKQRGKIRGKAFSAAYTGYLHHNQMTYTEGSLRWSGIDGHHRAYRHEFPPFADCSAFVTWCYWDATRAEKTWDFVNGDNWAGGYTGTMTEHGADVSGNELLMADAVFYGGSWSVPAHVALYIGKGKVISHGQPGDPRIYPLNLNGVLPITRFKRYIR
jgi:cell wall-associated NlpC family hydrolase